MVNLPDIESSIWRQSYRNLYGSLDTDIEVGVVIVGAGITGLTSAYLLKQAGKKVAVLDKDSVGGGTTGRTTGKVTSQHGLIYNELQETLDKVSLKKYGESSEAARRLIETIIKREKIECDWETDDNYVFTTDQNKIKLFKDEANAASAMGLPASYVTETSLPFKISAAVRFTDQGKINAQKYLTGLAAAIQGEGSYVCEKSKVTNIQDGSPCKVKSNGHTIIASQIIIATNVPTLPLVARGAYCALEYPTESYIVAADLNSSLSGMYISPDSNHYSLLPITVDGHRRLLVGGGGHLSGLRVSKKWRFNRLANYANKYFGIDNFTHKWSDRDYIAYDKVPIIGKVYPWSKNLYVGTAYKKWGLTSGTAAAMVMSDIILGIENKWADIYSPQRVEPIKNIPKAVIEQIKQFTNP